MSVYSEQLEFQRRYGAKAYKRILKLSDALGYTYGESDTLLDVTNDEFKCILDAVEINQDKLKQAHQKLAEKKQAKKQAKQNNGVHLDAKSYKDAQQQQHGKYNQ